MDRKLVRTWRFAIIPVLSFAIMAPRLRHATFGLFDDARTLQFGSRVLAGDWLASVEAGAGRLRPIYWAYYALLKGIVGNSPEFFFLGNAILLFLTTLLLGLVAFLLLHNQPLAILAQALFLMSGPVVENAYTLSKPELLQSVWLLVSLLIIARTSLATRGSRLASASMASLAVLLAGLTKEKAPLVSVVAAVWVARAWGFERIGLETGSGVRRRLLYLAASVFGAALTLGLQRLAGSMANLQVGYGSGLSLTDLELIRSNAAIWADWLLRDYLYLPFLVVPGLALAVARRSWREFGLQLDLLMWMAAWLAVYLPWQFTPEYYLLPLALGAAILGAVSVQVILGWMAAGRLRKTIGAVAFGTAALFLALTLPNNITNGQVQLAMDRANSDLLEHIVQSLPAGSVLLINIQEPNEFVGLIPVWLNDLLDRPDIQVDHVRFQDIDSEYGPGRAIFIASPSLENQFYPSVRLGVYESSSNAWNESLEEAWGDDLVKTYETWYRFRSLAIDASCIFHPLLRGFSFCQRPDSPVDTRRFGYGWVLYRYERSQAH